MKKKILSTLIALSLLFSTIVIIHSVTADPIGLGPEDAIELHKKMWDEESGSWVDNLHVNVGENIRFNISVTYHDWDGPLKGFKLYDVIIDELLPEGLDYAGNATDEEPYINISDDGKNITWDFTGKFILNKTKCSYYLEFDVYVNSHGEHVNVVEVNAIESCYGEPRYAETTATVFAYDFVSRDVDDDGKLEKAIDINMDPSDGYEFFVDDDLSSEAEKSTDGDNDSKLDHFIDINDDDIPDRYWDPDDDILTDIQIIDVDYDGTDEWVFDSDEDGELDKYYDPDDDKIHPYVVYVLTTTADGHGVINTDPDGTVFLEDFEVELTAIPDPGYMFDHWSQDLSGNTNPVNIIMDSDKEVTATFSDSPEYTLTINIIGNGSVSKNPDNVTYPLETIVELTANPDEGWSFSHWNGDLSGTSNPNYIIMDSDKEVNATFVIAHDYTLTVNIDGMGIVEIDPDQPNYEPGTEVQLTASGTGNSHSYSEFSHWSGDLTGDENPKNIIMDSDKNITAHFNQTIIPYTLTVNVEGNGTVNIDPDQETYEYGDEVELTANPDEGWSFSHWSGALSGNNNPETIFIGSDETVTAHFTQKPQHEYTLTINIIGNGTVVKTPNQPTYTNGTYVELYAPACNELECGIQYLGWEFSHWSGDLSGSENPATILMDGNKTVTATFIYIPPEDFTLTVYTVGNGSVSKNPDQETYNEYDFITVELTANADSGWKFDHWSGDLSGEDNPENIFMNGDKTVTAHFTQHNEPPNVELIKPKKGFLYINDNEKIRLLLCTIIVGPLTIIVNATDDDGIDKVEFYIDDEKIGEDSTNQYSYLYNETTLIPRRHTLKVIAYDNTGNNKSCSITFWQLRYHKFLREHPWLSLGLILGAGGSAFLLSRLLSGRDNRTAPEDEEDNKPTVDTGGPYEGFINEPIEFDGSRSRGKDGAKLTFEWDFGDGTTDYGEKPTHTYTEPKVYTITLKVTDENGNTDSRTTTVTISEPEGEQETDEGDKADEEDDLFWYLVTAFSVLLTIALLGVFIKGGKFYV